MGAIAQRYRTYVADLKAYSLPPQLPTYTVPSAAMAEEVPMALAAETLKPKPWLVLPGGKLQFAAERAEADGRLAIHFSYG